MSDLCDHCELDIIGTPCAFPLSNMAHEEWLRFCSFGCLEAYDTEHQDSDTESESVDR